MPTDDSSAPMLHLIPVDHAALRPCPQCGARQWLQGVTYYHSILKFFILDVSSGGG